MTGRWFRVYQSLVDDPKVQRLPADVFRGLINLWCVASQNDGLLPGEEDIAFKLRLPLKKVRELLKQLEQAGLIDRDDLGIRPHNWSARQFTSDVSTERVRRHRERQRNVSSGVPATPSETPPDTDTDTDKSARARDGAVVLDEFKMAFWPKYPNKVGKPAALRAWRGARRRAELKTIMHGLDRYVANKPAERPWLNPSTFLNQDRWADAPSPLAASPARAANSLDGVQKVGL